MERGAFEGNALWSTLETCEGLLRDCEQWLTDASAPSASQLRWVLATLRSHDDPSDPAPYAQQALDPIQSALVQVQSALEQVTAAEDGAHLKTADVYIDQLTALVAALPQVTNRDPARTAGRTFADYRAAAEQALQALRDQNAKQARLLDERAEAQAELQAEYEQLAASLKESIQGLETQIATDEERLRKELTNTNEAFNSSQTERTKEFTAWLEKQESEFSDLLEPYMSSVIKIKTDAAAAFTEIDSLRDDTNKVAGLATGDLLSKRFDAYSKSQFWAGIVANVVGLIALAAGALVVVFTLDGLGPADTISWQYATLKLGITVTTVAAAVVAFRLGGHFLGESRHAKKVALELHAIGPFLADIDDPAQAQAAKTEFLQRTFGPTQLPAASEDAVPVSAVSAIIESAGKLLGR